MKPFWASTDWLSARTAISPEKTALEIYGRGFSFSRLDSLVSSLCGYLAQQGVGRGEHVGMFMSNSLAAVCTIFATARIGAVLVPLNIRLTTEELAWQLRRSHCTRVIGQAPIDKRVEQATSGLIPLHSMPATAAEFEAWVDTLPANPAYPYDPVLPESLQAIIFTSGTTGFPKGAMITFANHFWSAVGSAFKLGVLPEDRWLACLPLYHVGGLAILFRSCLYGTTVVLQNGFEVDTVMVSLAQDNITLISLVPTMLGRLLECGLSGRKAPGLRLVLLGGAAAPVEALTEASAAELPIAITYGLTEACSQVATLMPSSAKAKPGCAGRPLLFTEINVLDEDGQETGPNTPGEITIKGPSIMAGYYDDIQATEAVLRNGYLHTGDIGFKDEDGDLWILDRRSDLIISGGENVYPAEVERVLRTHPAVKAACVVGLPHPEWGRQVAAMVVLNEQKDISAEELIVYSRSYLAGYKQPRLIVFVDALPLTGSGKVRRNQVAGDLASLQEPA